MLYGLVSVGAVAVLVLVVAAAVYYSRRSQANRTSSKSEGGM